MKYAKVPYLCDVPEHRGGMIESKMSGDRAFLDYDGHLHMMNRKVADSLVDMAKEIDVLQSTVAALRNQKTPVSATTPILSKEFIHIPSIVDAIERIGRAIR